LFCDFPIVAKGSSLLEKLYLQVASLKNDVMLVGSVGGMTIVGLETFRILNFGPIGIDQVFRSCLQDPRNVLEPMRIVLSRSVHLLVLLTYLLPRCRS
jgi:hypothetical protein